MLESHFALAFLERNLELYIICKNEYAYENSNSISRHSSDSDPHILMQRWIFKDLQAKLSA
jgi:hypothetical protein